MPHPADSLKKWVSATQVRIVLTSKRLHENQSSVVNYGDNAEIVRRIMSRQWNLIQIKAFIAIPVDIATTRIHTAANTKANIA